MSEFDVADLIAGSLGVSRGMAYELMRRALSETGYDPEYAPAAWGLWNTEANCLTRRGIYKNEKTAKCALKLMGGSRSGWLRPVPLYLKARE